MKNNKTIRGHIIISPNPTLTAAIWDAIDHVRTEEGADVGYRAITGDGGGKIIIEIKPTRLDMPNATPPHKRVYYAVWRAAMRLTRRFRRKA